MREFFKSDKENIRCAIYGLFDFAAIPENEIDEVIGNDQNPIPFAEFLTPLKFKRPIFSTKLSQNAPCTCGSGKKYKRCCGK